MVVKDHYIRGHAEATGPMETKRPTEVKSGSHRYMFCVGDSLRLAPALVISQHKTATFGYIVLEHNSHYLVCLLFQIKIHVHCESKKPDAY